MLCCGVNFERIPRPLFSTFSFIESGTDANGEAWLITYVDYEVELSVCDEYGEERTNGIFFSIRTSTNAQIFSGSTDQKMDPKAI